MIRRIQTLNTGIQKANPYITFPVFLQSPNLITQKLTSITGFKRTYRSTFYTIQAPIECAYPQLPVGSSQQSNNRFFSQCKMFFYLTSSIVPKHYSIVICTQPCLIFSFRLYTCHITCIIYFELKYAFAIVRDTLLVSSNPYNSISVCIQRINRIMR